MEPPEEDQDSSGLRACSGSPVFFLDALHAKEVTNIVATVRCIVPFLSASGLPVLPIGTKTRPRRNERSKPSKDSILRKRDGERPLRRGNPGRDRGPRFDVTGVRGAKERCRIHPLPRSLPPVPMRACPFFLPFRPTRRRNDPASSDPREGEAPDEDGARQRADGPSTGTGDRGGKGGKPRGEGMDPTLRSMGPPCLPFSLPPVPGFPSRWERRSLRSGDPRALRRGGEGGGELPLPFQPPPIPIGAATTHHDEEATQQRKEQAWKRTRACS